MRIGALLIVVAMGLAAATLAVADDLEQGIALFGEGKFAEAETVLRKVEGPEATAYLAASLAKLKKYGDAETAAKAALEANATHDVAVAALGEALVGQKKYDEAVTRLTTVLEKKDGVAYAYFWRAQAYDKQDKAARMVADYESFLKLAPKAPEAGAVQAVLSGLR